MFLIQFYFGEFCYDHSNVYAEQNWQTARCVYLFRCIFIFKRAGIHVNIAQIYVLHVHSLHSICWCLCIIRNATFFAWAWASCLTCAIIVMNDDEMQLLSTIQNSMANIKPSENATEDEKRNPSIQLNQIPLYITSTSIPSVSSFSPCIIWKMLNRWEKSGDKMGHFMSCWFISYYHRPNIHF